MKRQYLYIEVWWMKVIYIIFALFIVGCSSVPIGKKYSKVIYTNQIFQSDALIVGVGKYKNRIRPLSGVKKDLKKIKKFFNNFHITHITTLENNKARLKDVRDAFNSYIYSTKNRKENTFIFYYSGHGIQVIDSNGDEKDNKDEATALYDIDLNDKDFITGGVLLDDELHSLLAQIDSKKIIIFDKCHSGSSHRGNSPYIKSIKGEYKLSTKFLEDINQNIKSKKPLKDFIIFSATKDDQEAEDSPIGGLFTNSFVDGIIHKKADRNNDNKITIAELEKFCGENISALASEISRNNKNISLKGKFKPYFAPKEVKNNTISSIFNFIH